MVNKTSSPTDQKLSCRDWESLGARACPDRRPQSRARQKPGEEEGSDVPYANRTDQGLQVQKWCLADTNEREIPSHLRYSWGQAEGPTHLLASSCSASKSLKAQVTTQTPANYVIIIETMVQLSHNDVIFLFLFQILGRPLGG